MIKQLQPKDFAELFGIQAKELPTECLKGIEKGDFRYNVLSGSEKEQVVLDVFKKLDSNTFSKAGKKGIDRWEKGWGENLKEFLQSGHDPSKLIPKYIRPSEPLRLNQEYILPVSSTFEFDWYAVFRKWLFKTYFSDAKVIYEFGSGSGFNLAELGSMYPEKKFYGLDWARPSVEIVNELAKHNGWSMKGLQFDFFSPDKSIQIEPDATVFTIGALEQTGTDYGAFLEYLLKAKPKLCVHVEPILEWYDPNVLIDYAAIRFHSQRNYWQGYPASLEELEKKGKIKIVKKKRSFFGSLYLEGYSQLIWRPL